MLSMWCSLQQKTPRRMQGQRSHMQMVVALKVISRKCCKKSGNFPKDSNRQNQSSTGSTKMNYVHTAPLPQTEADFFNEKGLLKEYRPPVQHQQQQQYQQMGGMFALRKIPIIPSSVSESVPDPAPSPDFPFQEFPLTEVVTQSQIDSSSIFRYVGSERNQ